ncbi:MAG TPA: galactose-1-phosphate uridylyltransferase [Cytophagaceae bacterium]|jgi:UDPglucose--hexose-1-phosphate uridylyltransferase
MSELRWNPLLKTYTMVASNRQGRPDMPKDWCPFCPGSGKVPDHYDVLIYPNDFPALSSTPPKPDLEDQGVYTVEESYGQCEVILYSPEHYTTLPELPVDHIVKLINLWAERFKKISEDKKVKYIFEFENRGAEVGVTMPHPHGQIYGYPFIPLKITTELDSCKEHYEKNGSDLLGDMNREEIKFQKRVIAENDSFICYLPFFTDYPYGIFIVSKSLKGDFTQFNESERRDLATILKNCTGALDKLFDKQFPYMMCIHQTPVNVEDTIYKDCKDYYRFHIEFYPPLRDAKRIKFYASSEMGAWAAANTRAVEETAVELREAYNRFLKENNG